MAEREIPRAGWKTFFDDLSREHEQGQVTVEVRGDMLPQQAALQELPLLGISYDDKGSGAGQIHIMAGSDVTTNSSYTVESPTLVRATTTPDGDVDTVTIDAQEGMKKLK
jgi:hypothetical protein